jgi:mono/diheme cytochrome c family protein
MYPVSLLLRLALFTMVLLLAACSSSDNDVEPITPPPTLEEKIALGKDVLRYETFGNERFWTDLMQLPQGIAGAGITPLQALGVGLNVNVEALSPATAQALLGALNAIAAGTPATETVLGNPAVTLALINENAVIGVVAIDKDGKRKPLGSDAAFKASDSLDLARGDKVGVSCALCHANTDGSVVPVGFAGLSGSVGKQQDGFIPEKLDVGTIFALSGEPRAYLPFFQLSFESLSGASVGRGDFTGLKRNATADDVRAYLTGQDPTTGERYYPVGTFDAFPDGIGNHTALPYFLETKLAANWGHGGIFAGLDDFNNLVYTVGLDPTTLVTTTGKTLLKVLAGPVGDEIAERYEAVLREIGALPAGKNPNEVFPLLEFEKDGIDPGNPEGPLGVRVSQEKLEAMRLYTDSLKAPAAPANLNAGNVAAGQMVFSASGCIACHQSNPKAAVGTQVTPLSVIYPGYIATTLHNRSAVNLPTNVEVDLQSPAGDFSSSISVFDAGLVGQGKGFAEPLLLGLALRSVFLHDGSIRGSDARDALNKLFNPERGLQAPHPYYVENAVQRSQLIEYLLSRDTR